MMRKRKQEEQTKKGKTDGLMDGGATRPFPVRGAGAPNCNLRNMNSRTTTPADNYEAVEHRLVDYKANTKTT